MVAGEADYDDPDVEDAWCEERLGEVAAYVRDQRIPHRSIGEWPAWHVAPYVSIWALESATRPGWVGNWVICGDLPTDHVGKAEAEDPREAVRAFARRWREAAPLMGRGESHAEVMIGRTPEERKSLAPLLQSRAELLARWAEDDEIWEDLEEDD
ncbi:MAG TPA: DUF4826 family protein [Allosphingosinicella sp.]|nr:DUF4826 family protein [Allosphingosinicella sp.]